MTAKIDDICRQYGVALCYLFGSQQTLGLARLRGEAVQEADPGSDIDVAVWFAKVPDNPLDTYANLSLALETLVSPFKADLVFLHDVDHIIQLEAIRGVNLFAVDEAFKDAFEARVMALAADEALIFQKNERDFLEAIRDGYFEFEYQADSGSTGERNRLYGTAAPPCRDECG